MTDGLDIPWDPGIGSAFIGDGLPQYAAHIMFELSLTTVICHES